MNHYAVLLRAIGPVSHAIMRPSVLRDAAEAAGYGDPVNYLATGNLILSTRKGAETVRREVTKMVEGLGLMTSEVFVVPRATVEAVVAANPLPEAARDRPQRLGVCFFHEARDWPDTLLRPAGPEVVAAVGSMLVIDYGPGEAPSRLNVERLAGARMTQRNWNTVLGVWERLRGR
jgi:uncharacterized protein (DUF1697 family)